MAAKFIPVKKPYVQQPTTPASIDWDNPLTAGLVVAALPMGSLFYEVITSQFSQAVGTQGIKQPIDGNGNASIRLINPGTSSKLPNPTGADSLVGAWSVFSECSPEVNARPTQPIFVSTEPSNGFGFGVSVDDASAQYNALRAGNSYTVNTATSSVDALGTNSELYLHRAAWTWDTTNFNFYTKRNLNSQQSSATPPSAASTRRCYFLTSVAGVAGQASASLILVWNRALSLVEYQKLYDNPWQVFSPKNGKIWINVSAGGDVSVSLSGTTLTFSTGTMQSGVSYTPSGTSLTSSQGTVKNAVAFALSGQALTSSTGTAKSAISYTLTGQSLAVSQGTITASTGGDISVSLSGTALAISSGTLTSAITQALSGDSVTASRGTVVPSVSQTLAGASTTTSVGTLTSSIARALSGSTLTTSTGTLSTLSGTIVTIKAGSWIRYRTI